MTNSSISFENILRFVFNWATRCLSIGVLIYCTIVSLNNYSWFTWHVVLCTAGIIPLMAEALILFDKYEFWYVSSKITKLNRSQKYWIHGLLISVGTLFVTVGCIETFLYLEPGYHLYTVHGITGLVSMILFLLSMFMGLAVIYSSKIKFMTAASVKFLHNSFGLLGYIIGLVSLGYSYYTNWFIYYTTSEQRMICLILTILVGVWSINKALVSGYNQIKTILS